MEEIAELGEESKHLDWLKSMGLWECCFFVEVYYIEEGRIGCDSLAYDDYWMMYWNYDDWFFDLHEWYNSTMYLRDINKRHKWRKHAIVK